MKRRTVVMGGVAALLAQTGALAQDPGRSYRVGALLPTAGLAARPYLAALRERLAAHGFDEGRNLTIEPRYPTSSTEVEGLIPEKLDAVFTCTSIVTGAALSATKSVPVVFAWVADPVASGFVQSLGRPGGRATGVRTPTFELTKKRLELLRELLPSATRVAMAALFFDATSQVNLRHAKDAASRLGFELIRIAGISGWSGAMRAAMDSGTQAVIVLTPFAVFGLRDDADEVVRLMLEHRIPVMFSDAESTELGGLISYSPDLLDEVRRAADLLAKVLRGMDPALIAVDQTVRFQLVVNLKAARAIGIEVPQSILLRADRVVE